MKRQIVKEFVTVKKVHRLPPPPPPAPPPPPKRRVLVVGRCALDMITICDQFPKPGDMHRTKEGCWRRGGSASNICSVLRRLGTSCEFLGLLSSAPAYEGLLSNFYAMGIDISSCPRTAHGPPHQSIIIVRDSGTRTTIEHSNRNHELTYQQFLGAVDYQKYAWVHFEARNPRDTLRMMNAIRDYNERCSDHIVMSVDLSHLDKPYLLLADMADYVFVRKQVMYSNAFMTGFETVWEVREHLRKTRAGAVELQPKKSYYLPDPSPDEDVCEAKTERSPIIVYSNNIEGSCCLLPDNTFVKVDSQRPMKIVDTVGEHDAFCGAIIFALHESAMNVRDSLEYATRVTSAKVAQNGFEGLRSIPKTLLGFYYA